MCLNVILLVWFLFYLGSLCSAINPRKLYTYYDENIYNNGIVFKGRTKYCRSREVKLWAVTCKRAVEHLRKYYGIYNEIYLHYKSFTNFNAMFYMCSKQEVKLETAYTSNHQFAISEYVSVKQHLTICFASPSIVPEDISPQTLPMYKHTAISVVPTDDERFINIMIFLKIEQHYIPIDWLKDIELQPSQDISIPHTLFAQDTPTSQSNQAKLYKILLKNADILKNEKEHNIVNSSNIEVFGRLCFLVIRKSQYPLNKRYVSSRMKPAGQERLAYFIMNTDVHIFKIKVYTCPKHRDVCENYYLSQGVDNKSVIVYKKKVQHRNNEQNKKKSKSEHISKSTSDHIINLEPYLELVEMISNVTEEYIKEIDLPTRKLNYVL